MAVEEIGIVTHNSFLQSYAELGLPGGSLFLAAFLAAIVGLIPGREEFTSDNRRQRRLHAAIFAVTTAYCVGILTLSRQFVAPTFMILGLATATQTTSPISLPYAMKFGNVLFIRSIVAGVFLLGSVYVITRFLNFSQ